MTCRQVTSTLIPTGQDNVDAGQKVSRFRASNTLAGSNDDWARVTSRPKYFWMRDGGSSRATNSPREVSKAYLTLVLVCRRTVRTEGRRLGWDRRSSQMASETRRRSMCPQNWLRIRIRNRKTTACAATGRRQYLNSDKLSSTHRRFRGTRWVRWKKYRSACNFNSFSSRGSCHFGHSKFILLVTNPRISSDGDKPGSSVSDTNQLIASNRKQGSTLVSCITPYSRSTIFDAVTWSISLANNDATTSSAWIKLIRDACRRGRKWWNTTRHGSASTRMNRDSRSARKTLDQEESTGMVSSTKEMDLVVVRTSLRGSRGGARFGGSS
mmetsp:Transcript_32186/g.83488  ORF Transcript_32186/g.83488 Transcript_32186/m.83488 type:complete len:325 (-) Transcript_32186:4-978(-)